MKIAAGFITYGDSTARYLPYFLKSLKDQTFKNFEIIALDNSEEENNQNKNFILKNYPEINFSWAGSNLGFAKGYNEMIEAARRRGAEYFLALNPDMILEPETLEKLVLAVEADGNIGAAQPKILKWDFMALKRHSEAEGREIPSGNPTISESLTQGGIRGDGRDLGKTDIIDSFGLVVDKKFRFYDRFQGDAEELHPAAGREEVFGFTGAAVLFRVKALEDTAFNNHGRKEYFDGSMFMYKEDCDLSYRLRLAGFKTILVPEAIVYHDRTAASLGSGFWQTLKNRRNKSRSVKKWSFLNQWIMLLKFKDAMPEEVRKESYNYYLKASIFILFFEPYLLKQVWELWKIRKEIKKRRQTLSVRINMEEMEKFIS